MTLLLLIRHGENDYVGKRLAGRLPGIHLNERGRQQAERLAETLKDAPIRAIYSSPLERATDTAAPLAARLHLPIQIHAGLLEIDYGGLAGKTGKQLQRLKQWKQVQEQPSTYTFPNGESFITARERVTAALQEIAANHEDHDLVACFSHHDSLTLAISALLDMPLDSYHKLSLGTASISLAMIGKDHTRLVRMNWSQGFEWPKPPK